MVKDDVEGFFSAYCFTQALYSRNICQEFVKSL